MAGEPGAVTDRGGEGPRLGLLLPFGLGARAEAIAARAQESEAAGFDSAWVAECAAAGVRQVIGEAPWPVSEILEVRW